MKYLKWIKKNGFNLKEHNVLVIGATGSIGRYLCKYLAYLNSNLILACRNIKLGEELKVELLNKYNIRIKVKYLDISSIDSVNNFLKENLDITDIISLAGVYHLNKSFTVDGYEIHYATNTLGNVNLIDNLIASVKPNGKIIVTSSIAANFVKGNCLDFDFKNETNKINIYGATKRILNYSLNYLKQEKYDNIVIAHPGISATSIFKKSHSMLFMKLIFPIMRLVFISPEKASLSILYGMFKNVPYGYQVGPKVFSIWGYPSLKKLNKNFCDKNECSLVYNKVIKDYKRGI